jgi:hypothetical protein
LKDVPKGLFGGGKGKGQENKKMKKIIISIEEQRSLLALFSAFFCS